MILLTLSQKRVLEEVLLLVKKVPEIRFKGFYTDWEQRKLGEEATIVVGGDIDKAKLLKSGKYPVLANALTNDGIVGYYEDNYRIGAPAVTVTGRGDVGYAKARRTNFTPVVRLLAVTSDHDIDFLEAALNNHKKIIESTGVPQLTSPQLAKYKILFPSLEEEKKIGAFFNQLDQTIALHLRKLQALQQLKKGFLQKMFPENQEKVPQIRFAHFQEEWEQLKLGNLIEQVIREVPKPDTPYERLSVRSHAKGTFHQHVDDPSKIAMEKLYVVRKNDLIVNITFAWEHAIAVANEFDDGLLVSHRFPMYRADGKSDIKFLHYMVSQEEFRQKLELISPGGAGRNRVLSKKDFLKLEVVVPKEIEEQKRIGTFFNELDKTIILHQSKLEKLKQIKKSLLQKMFI